MLTYLKRCSLAFATLFLGACSTVSVTTDYDHAAAFTRYRSYSVEAAPGDLPLSPSGEAALQETLRGALAARGIREATEGADLQIVRHVFTKEKISVSPSSGWGYGGYPYRYGRYGMWTGAPGAYNDVTQYTEGTLILDFVDGKTQKLVFRGVATGTVSDPQTNAKHIREAVNKMMQEFPGAAPQ